MKKILKYSMVAIVLASILSLITCKSTIEEDLVSRSNERLRLNGQDWASVTASGRDLTLKGESPSFDQVKLALNTVKNVDGVRIVIDATNLLPPLLYRAKILLENNSIGWIRVSGNDEHIILTGHSQQQAEIDNIISQFESLRGLKMLTNNLLLVDENNVMIVKALKKNKTKVFNKSRKNDVPAADDIFDLKWAGSNINRLQKALKEHLIKKSIKNRSVASTFGYSEGFDNMFDFTWTGLEVYNKDIRI